MSIRVLGVRIDTMNLEQAKARATSFLNEGQLHTIWTPNPEMLVAAHRSADFRSILNSGDLNLCDGSGISLLTKKKVMRIHGSDFALDICDIAQREGKRLFLLGGSDERVVKKAADTLQKKFSKLTIAGAMAGPKLHNTSFAPLDEGANKKILSQIKESRADILLVGFGHGKQETWIETHKKELNSVRIAMGIGGTLDMLAGAARRAPVLLRKLHLEWFWRLLREPQRIARMWNAVIVFPLLYIGKQRTYEHHN